MISASQELTVTLLDRIDALEELVRRLEALRDTERRHHIADLVQILLTHPRARHARGRSPRPAETPESNFGENDSSHE